MRSDGLEPRPRAGVEGRARGRDGRVDVGRAGRGDLGDGLSVCGETTSMRSVGGWRRPRTADEQLVLVHPKSPPSVPTCNINYLRLMGRAYTVGADGLP